VKLPADYAIICVQLMKTCNTTLAEDRNGVPPPPRSPNNFSPRLDSKHIHTPGGCTSCTGALLSAAQCNTWGNTLGQYRLHVSAIIRVSQQGEGRGIRWP